MNAQNIAKSVWEELTAFLSWAAPAIWNIFAEHSKEKEEVHVTGVIETEGGYFFTMHSDGTTDSGPSGVKGPFS